MKKLIVSITVVSLLSLTGCQRYYFKSNLNQIKIGQTKERILAIFPGERFATGAPGMEIRAAHPSSNGKLLEVGEVFLTDGVTPTVSHWFMFEDGLLVQWGRPEDWKKATARYDINFNPSLGVPLN